MLLIYKALTAIAAVPLTSLLKKRVRRGKESATRYTEKMGQPSRSRPKGKLLWLHAASVGEVQSALILIDKIRAAYPTIEILITTGTRTSASYLENRLPDRCVHQFYPLDHPVWVSRFLDHWQPDIALWMESELWPNMVLAMKQRGIPAALLNARMSSRSFARWRWLSGSIRKILGGFDMVVAQNNAAQDYYKKLGAQRVMMGGNLKYSAVPLFCDESEYEKMLIAAHGRPLWLYASTHEGEEALACDVHGMLKNTLPSLLTVIVPRHPERGEAIERLCKAQNLNAIRRGDGKRLPDEDTDIYIADTLGELGLFYRLSPLSMVGRSFSKDGGGGHNPIEPAQLGSAVLSGVNVQHFQDVYDEMWEDGAAMPLGAPEALFPALQTLLTDPAALERLRKGGRSFAQRQRGIVDGYMTHLMPLLQRALGKPESSDPTRQERLRG